MKEIPLTQGRVVIVDDEDYEGLARYKWHALRSRRTWYACRDTQGKTLYIHRVILGAGVEQVDHIDGDGLNNQRANLRLCTPSQNHTNAAKYRLSNASSRYRGVSRNGNGWRARCGGGNTQHYLGTFASEVEAARAYNEAAKRLYGEFACLNDLPDS